MEVNVVQDLLIKILRSELTETELDISVREQLTPDVISALFSLSKSHDLAHMVACSLYENGLLNDGESLAEFSREEMISVYRYEQMSHAYSEIRNALNNASVPYIPLKGFVIRQYYPKGHMRTSCDIDVLIKEENLDIAIDTLVKCGYKCGERLFHDISLFSPSNVHLELHFNILENIESLDRVLVNAWDHASSTETSECRFSDEFFQFHMFAHMSYHFLSGGCGIKSLMDVWIMKNKMGITYESSEELLRQAGIYKFAEKITALVDACFSGGEKDEFSDLILSYIFSGGIYGTEQNKIAMAKAGSDGSFKYALKRLFPTYKAMSCVYPVLKNAPFLLPIFYIVRLVGKVFGGKSKNAVREMQIASNVSGERVDYLQRIKDHLGL